MPRSGLSPPHAPVTRAPLKRIAVVRIPEEERVLHVRVVPTWLPHPASASQVRGTARVQSGPDNTQKKTSAIRQEAPPPLVRGKWSRASWMLKHKLDIPPYETLWNMYKPYTNAYERIHVSSNHQRASENVASYVPLSRSYFKMWELLHDYPLATMADGMQSVHLAEGPGGFIEALCRYRNRRARRRDAKCVHDRYTGITLKPHRKDVPGWNKSARLLKAYPQIALHYGADGTGNLYDVRNIHRLARDVGRHTSDLVTGDGGIDYSVDFAMQEQLSFRILLAQLYAALLLLKTGRAMVLKFFDTHHPFTHEMLWVVACVFDAVHLVKPVTSRVANSERYVVAMGYRGCPGAVESALCRALTRWRADRIIDSLLAQPPPEQFVAALHAYSEWYAEQQHRSIHTCFGLIDEAVVHMPAKTLEALEDQAEASCQASEQHYYRPVRVVTNDPNFEARIATLAREQYARAEAWCERYDVATMTEEGGRATR